MDKKKYNRWFSRIILLGTVISLAMLPTRQLEAKGRQDSSDIPPPEKLAIVVNEDLKPLIEANLNAFVADLKERGHPVVVREWSLEDEPRPADLKSYLMSVPALDGAIFIGQLPIAWYEYAYDFDGYARWPCDLYYMDFAATWSDTNANNIFDSVTMPSPSIWVSRLTFPDMLRVYPGLSEADHINRYFVKNRAFRTGELRLQHIGMSYVDDNRSAEFGAVGMDAIYGSENMTVVRDNQITTKVDFMSRWSIGYEHVFESAHGSPGRMIFRDYDDPTIVGSIRSIDLAQNEHKVLFWNFYSCSLARFTSPDFMAGSALLSPKYDLLALGSTKSGAMNSQEVYYRAIAEKDSHGEAYRKWFATSCDPNVHLRRTYGMTMFGDGTLKIGRLFPTSTGGAVAPPEETAITADTTESLMAHIGDPQTSLGDRVKLIQKAGITSDSNTVPLLIDALTDDNSIVRREAARSLGMIGDSKALYPLVGSLHDSDPTVIQQAALSLGKLGRTEIVGNLVTALNRSEHRIDGHGTTVGLFIIGGLRRLVGREATNQIIVEPLIPDDSKPVSLDAINEFYDKVEIGMTQDEIRVAVGEPSHTKYDSLLKETSFWYVTTDAEVLLSSAALAFITAKPRLGNSELVNTATFGESGTAVAVFGEKGRLRHYTILGLPPTNFDRVDTTSIKSASDILKQFGKPHDITVWRHLNPALGDYWTYFGVQAGANVMFTIRFMPDGSVMTIGGLRRPTAYASQFSHMLGSRTSWK